MPPSAGNSSGQNDAASMCIVTTEEKAAELGLTPLVRLVSWGVAGVPPNVMGIGPVPATRLALAKAGLTLADMDLIELNEAFASQSVATCALRSISKTSYAMETSAVGIGHIDRRPLIRRAPIGGQG